MKQEIIVDEGMFTAEGKVVKPAVITIKFYDLELSEYKGTMSALAREFKIDYASSVFRQNRDVIVQGQDAIHDGQNPHEGDHTRT
jgi:hypothetical protein